MTTEEFMEGKIYCPSCGTPLAQGHRFCGNCGSSVPVATSKAQADASDRVVSAHLDQPIAAPASQPEADPGVWQVQQPQQETSFHEPMQAMGTQRFAATPTSGMAIVSLILGILSILLSPFLVGVIVGIIAIILAAIARKHSKESISLAGLITGIVGTVFSVLIIVLVVVIVCASM